MARNDPQWSNAPCGLLRQRQMSPRLRSDDGGGYPKEEILVERGIAEADDERIRSSQRIQMKIRGC
jgi:hypothetical protein